MGKYYCDYCDIYLTHDSMNARKAHNTGRNHIANVRDYFASLGHDKAQNIIDQIIQQHESGGRMPMMPPPSMRMGAGFMAPGGMPPPGMNLPPFPPQNNFPPQGGPPPFRPPFPPNGAPSMPPFAPPNGMMSGPPNGMPPFPPPAQGGLGPRPPFPPPNGIVNGISPSHPNGFNSSAPPPNFTPAQGPPAGGNPAIHPDRLRMLGM